MRLSHHAPRMRGGGGGRSPSHKEFSCSCISSTLSRSEDTRGARRDSTCSRKGRPSWPARCQAMVPWRGRSRESQAPVRTSWRVALEGASRPAKRVWMQRRCVTRSRTRAMSRPWRATKPPKRVTTRWRSSTPPAGARTARSRSPESRSSGARPGSARAPLPSANERPNSALSLHLTADSPSRIGNRRRLSAGVRSSIARCSLAGFPLHRPHRRSEDSRPSRRSLVRPDPALRAAAPGLTGAACRRAALA